MICLTDEDEMQNIQLLIERGGSGTWAIILYEWKLKH